MFIRRHKISIGITAGLGAIGSVCILAGAVTAGVIFLIGTFFGICYLAHKVRNS